MASIKCGNCGLTHESVAEVMKCYRLPERNPVRVNAQGETEPDQGNPEFRATTVAAGLRDFNKPTGEEFLGQFVGERRDLNVPFAEKDHAKGFGARWDPEKRTWYIEGDIPEDMPKKWLVKAESGPLFNRRAKREPIEDGFYKFDGEVYRVVHNQEETAQYASKMRSWDIALEVLLKMDHKEKPNLEWDYAPGIVNQLTSAMRFSKEEAEQFGKLYGSCAICGRKLRNPDSIKRGIGPVCAGKEGWL